MEPLSVEELRQAFNEAQDDVRLVSLLSPTCGECIEGHEVVKQMFDRFESDDLKALNVWLPMLQDDNSSAATEQAGTFQDERILTEGWDEKRVIGKAFEKTLDLTRTAWDVYLVYEPGVTWEDELPPKPTFWMHQLTEDSGADQEYCLNPGALASEIKKVLPKPYGDD